MYLKAALAVSAAALALTGCANTHAAATSTATETPWQAELRLVYDYTFSTKYYALANHFSAQSMCEEWDRGRDDPYRALHTLNPIVGTMRGRGDDRPAPSQEAVTTVYDYVCGNN